jgi:hypothetical protein
MAFRQAYAAKTVTKSSKRKFGQGQAAWEPNSFHHVAGASYLQRFVQNDDPHEDGNNEENLHELPPRSGN